jgi:integrase
MTTTRKRRDIDKAHVRKSIDPEKGCPPRHEPYWGAPLGKGRVVGFRRIDANTGSWIARMRNETGRKVYKALGDALAPPGSVTPTLDYEQARAAALKWFEGRDAGVEDDKITVADACRAYVDERRRSKSEACAHDAEMRFKRTVYGTAFGGIMLAKLRTPRIEEWRDGLGISKPSANRTLTALKAAFNLAVRQRRVMPAAEREWADVAPYKMDPKERRRNLYLDRGQRRKLIEAAGDGALRDLMEAAALTGARAGELTKAKRSQLDTRLGTMAFTGKTGTRNVRLPPAALALFKRRAKSKLPGALLFTRDDGKPWDHSDWDELVRAAATAAKLPKGVCLYTLRHSFITQAIADGMTTLDVARFVGTSLLMIDLHYGQQSESAHERLSKVAIL